MLIPDVADSLGGGGSLADSIRALAVTGLSRAIDGELSRKYPLTAGEQNRTVDADGKVRPVGAPGARPTAGAAFAGFIQNPTVMLVGVAVVASLALFFVLRK